MVLHVIQDQRPSHSEAGGPVVPGLPNGHLGLIAEVVVVLEAAA